MQNTIAKTKSHNQSVSIYQSIVMNLLNRMTQGYLEVNMPNGEQYIFGEENFSVCAEINIHDAAFFKKCVFYGDIGFGEAYVEGLWSSPNITNVISWFLLNVQNAPTLSGSKTRSLAVNLLRFVNKIAEGTRENSLVGSRVNISAHYDLSNKFFSHFLDPSMTYSAAYFKNPGMTLEEAQYAKYEVLCEQLQIKASDHVLEIGSGWGANAIFMATRYGCKVTTTTISEEQYKLATERVKTARLEKQITVLLSDYRNLTGSYDKIISIEMLEAVGHEYYVTYFAKCHELLREKGMLGIQVITCPDSRFFSLKKGIDWIQKHIFPGSLLPSISAINQAVNRTGDLTLVNLQDFGLDYARTLKIWYDAFNSNWHLIRPLGFDQEFKRKWNYYLCYCEAAFKMRNINVMQLVYTRPNNTDWK